MGFLYCLVETHLVTDCVRLTSEIADYLLQLLPAQGLGSEVSFFSVLLPSGLETELRQSLLCSGKASQSSHRRVDENGTCSFKLKHRSPTTLLLLLILLITREPKNVNIQEKPIGGISLFSDSLWWSETKKAYLLRGDEIARAKVRGTKWLDWKERYEVARDSLNIVQLI